VANAAYVVLRVEINVEKYVLGILLGPMKAVSFSSVY